MEHNQLSNNDLQNCSLARTPAGKRSGTRWSPARDIPRIGLLATCLALVSIAGCNDRTKTERDTLNSSTDPYLADPWLDDSAPAENRPAAQANEQQRSGTRGLADLDFGEDWAPSRRRNQSEDVAAQAAPVDDAGYSTGSRITWSIVLHTFSGENHRQAAANMISQLASIDPMLAPARPHEREAGSLVVLGNYPSPQSANAQAHLERVRNITINNRPVFPRAMFTRIETGLDLQRLHPHHVLQARLQNPVLRDEHPVYTLEVAIWMAEGDSDADWQQAQRRAQADAARFRSEGLPAYFYHDGVKRISSVTIGAFDHTAWDPQANIESAAVKALRNRFEFRMVNGDILEELIDRDHVELGTLKQRPRLVLVPELPRQR